MLLLFADEFNQYFNYSFSVSALIWEKWLIESKFEILDGGDGGVGKGLQNNVSFTFNSISPAAEICNIEMSYRRIVLDD